MATVASRAMTFRDWLIEKILEATDRYTLDELKEMSTDDLAWLRDAEGYYKKEK